VTLRAFVNSTLTAGLAALTLAAVAALLAYFLGRRSRVFRGPASTVAAMAEISYAIPGLVISIAFILAFIRPVPLLGLSLYNTLAIIGLAYLTAFCAIALPKTHERPKTASASFFIEVPLVRVCDRLYVAGSALREAA